MEDEDEQLKKLLATNFGRLKNNPVKQGRVYKQYEELCGVRQGSEGKRSLDRQIVSLTQEDIARELGVDVKQLQRLKKLNSLSSELQELIETGELKATTGYKIWAKMSQDEQEKFLNEIGQDKIKSYIKKEK